MVHPDAVAAGCTPDRNSPIAFEGDYNIATSWGEVSTFDLDAVAGSSRGSGGCSYTIDFEVTSTHTSDFTTTLSFDYATQILTVDATNNRDGTDIEVIARLKMDQNMGYFDFTDLGDEAYLGKKITFTVTYTYCSANFPVISPVYEYYGYIELGSSRHFAFPTKNDAACATTVFVILNNDGVTLSSNSEVSTYTTYDPK